MNDCEAPRYEPLPEWTREEMEAVIERADPHELALLPLAAGLDPPDRDWTLATCLRLARHEDSNVRGNAILGIAYLGHTYQDLPELEVREVIDRGLRDADDWVRQRAQEAMDELSMWLKWRFPGAS